MFTSWMLFGQKVKLEELVLLHHLHFQEQVTLRLILQIVRADLMTPAPAYPALFWL